MRTPQLAALWPVAVLSGAVAAVALPLAAVSDVLERIVLDGLVYLVLVLALFAFTGLSGVFSFGQPAFMAIGAYTSAILTVPVAQREFLLPHLPSVLRHAHTGPVLAVLIGGAVAAVASTLLAVPLTRLSGVSASLVTLGVLFVVYTVARQWIALTNGTAGLSGVPVSLTPVMAVGWAVGALVVVYAFKQSRWGLQLQACREDEIAALSLGIPLQRLRGMAFVLAGFLSGVAGGLYSSFIGALTPDAFFVPTAFLTVAMLVVGGTATVTGAVTGTLALTSLGELLRRTEEGVSVAGVQFTARPGFREIILGGIMLAVLVARPAGLTGRNEVPWPWGARSNHADAPTARPVRTGAVANPKVPRR